MPKKSVTVDQGPFWTPRPWGKRDEIALAALPGFIANRIWSDAFRDRPADEMREKCAKACYRMADAMLAEREKGGA